MCRVPITTGGTVSLFGGFEPGGNRAIIRHTRGLTYKCESLSFLSENDEYRTCQGKSLMDTNPHDTPVAAGPDAGETAGRHKLWQLDCACREGLIRACLSARELKGLCRKLGIGVQPIA